MGDGGAEGWPLHWSRLRAGIGLRGPSPRTPVAAWGSPCIPAERPRPHPRWGSLTLVAHLQTREHGPARREGHNDLCVQLLPCLSGAQKVPGRARQAHLAATAQCRCCLSSRTHLISLADGSGLLSNWKPPPPAPWHHHLVYLSARSISRAPQSFTPYFSASTENTQPVTEPAGPLPHGANILVGKTDNEQAHRESNVHERSRREHRRPVRHRASIWAAWRGEGDEQVLLGAELWTVFQIEGGKCRGPGGISGGLIQGMAGEERKLRLEKVTETFQGDTESWS